MKLRLPRVEAPSIDNVERAVRVFCQLCGATARLALYLAVAYLLLRVATCNPQIVVGGPHPGGSQYRILIFQNEKSPTEV